jgi:hypothetical protein
MIPFSVFIHCEYTLLLNLAAKIKQKLSGMDVKV